MAHANDNDDFQVDQIDHVELFVPDRHAAAEWYHRVLGLEIVDQFRFWAESSGGPLMISTPNGNTKFALFEGSPKGSKREVGFHLVAFRVNGKAFAKFLHRLPELNLIDWQGRVVTADLVSDHTKAFSIYFCDPYGHHLELTTYDYDVAKETLKR